MPHRSQTEPNYLFTDDPPGLARANSAPTLAGSAGAAPSPEQLARLWAQGKARRKLIQELKIIGRGSEGTVKLIITPEGRRAAMKSMPKPPAEARVNRERFERDIRKRFAVMQAHNGHPHLPDYIELIETKEK